MKIEYRQGDMFAGPERVLVHGCNAQGVMGSGVAATVKRLFPEAFTSYRDLYEGSQAHGGLELGIVQFVPIHRDGKPLIMLGNAITQDNFGYDGKQYVSYDAVRKAMQEIDRIARETQDEPNMESMFARVAMPRIGSDRGGGDWSVIEAIIESESNSFQPVVYVL